jgi:hypothetical protein
MSKGSGALSPVVALVALLDPRSASATPGCAETHLRLEYSALASLHWVHPGDGCDRGNFCFFVERRAGTAGGFRGLACSLATINAPAEER